MAHFTFRFNQRFFTVSVDPTTSKFEEFKTWVKHHADISLDCSSPQKEFSVANYNILRACRLKAKKLELEASIIS